MKLKYGKRELKLPIKSDKIHEILKAEEKIGVNNPFQSVNNSLENPEGTESIQELITQKDPEDLVIIVNDVSRPTPYEFMLPPLLDKLHSAGIDKNQITFVIATGIHEPNTEKQNQDIFGEKLINEYEFISHDPDNSLVKIGELSTGNDLYINEKVAKADFIITTGVILPHYFAGFSGGRKSILPGVAGRESIEFNHSLMVDLIGDLPPVKSNKLSQEMFEAAEKVGVDFILNVVTNSNQNIVEVVAGDLKQAWYQGVDTSAAMYQDAVDKKCKVAIASAGGYPRDINLYQAQKALDHADHCVQEGGTIILVAECREDLGEETFSSWLEAADNPEDNIERIKEKFELGGHKAFAISKSAKNKELIVISNLDKETTQSFYAKKMDTLNEALAYTEDKYNGNFEAIIMPQGGLTVPVVQN